MESGARRPVHLSRYSCMSCKRLKKKCDRREPECSLCQRHGRSCSYRIVTVPARRNLTSGESTDALPGTPYRSQQFDGFPAVYFADSTLFEQSLGQLPGRSSDVVAGIQDSAESLSDIKQYTEVYFRDIHPWTPFLSKRAILNQVLSPLGGNRVDHSLLLTAIKLIVSTPCDNARSAAYCKIKTAFLDAELKGIFTLRLLQAQVLVALYEMGHAIYPSAYLTVGCCAKFGIALGVNRAINPNSSARSNSIDSEEERRTWWAIILLDRLMNVGCPERAPVTEEPESTSALPIDDKLWDAGLTTMGTESNGSPTLSSLPTGAMGRFALTVQAAFLLGKVLRNFRAPTGATDGNSFHEEEANILDKAILALTQVSLQESRQRDMGLCSPATICHSARLILNTQMLSWLQNSPDHEVRTESILNTRLAIASEMLGLARTINRTGLCGREESSPFCLDAMYRSALIYGQLSQNTVISDARGALDEIKRGLEANNRRWKAAGVYAQLIQARDIANLF